MGIVAGSMFSDFKNDINTLNLPLQDHDILNEKFLLEQDPQKKLEIYYTPFDYINERAKVVIVGITPGLHQMKKAYTTVLEYKDCGLGDEEILHQVKMKASFEGTMRKNLVAMLDELGLADHLGIPTTLELFSSASHLVYNTSLLPYAVFYDHKNFNGSRPNIMKTELLWKYVLTFFVNDIKRLRNPLIIPLGVNISKVLTFLADQQLIQNEYIVNGFPHPSGGNGHRHRQFRENKQAMKRQVDDFFSKSL
ncbi:uracil-DNA glycosylase family protein [Bacillus sp. USDA818B3_A]|uniref:uracil-DNA glycosylase family protein n=1 Tax=Bacillus sp. USDA818B3_A TaxID=2698834 RepID=UPI001F3DCC75|nr:uracil-DNA glycosylase family protein [Bacillus sp. USDA818B3_A]